VRRVRACQCGRRKLSKREWEKRVGRRVVDKSVSQRRLFLSLSLAMDSTEPFFRAQTTFFWLFCARKRVDFVGGFSIFSSLRNHQIPKRWMPSDALSSSQSVPGTSLLLLPLVVAGFEQLIGRQRLLFVPLLLLRMRLLAAGLLHEGEEEEERRAKRVKAMNEIDSLGEAIAFFARLTLFLLQNWPWQRSNFSLGIFVPQGRRENGRKQRRKWPVEGGARAE